MNAPNDWGPISASLAGVAVLIVFGLIQPPALLPDPGSGLLAWRSWRDGAPFNHVVTPDPSNIAADRSEFLAWWSPGQYLVPGALSLVVGRIGVAITLTSGLALLASLVGWVRIARYIGYQQHVTLALVLALLTARFATASFRRFDGGEILLLGATPWMVLWAMKAAWNEGGGLLSGLAVVVTAFLAKLSGLILACALVVASTWERLRGGNGLGQRDLRFVAGGLVALAGVQLLWLRGSMTPVGEGAPSLALGLGLSALGPWSAGLAMLDLLSWVLAHPARRLVSEPVWLLVALAPISVLVALLCLREGPVSGSHSRFRRLTLVTALGYCSLLSWFYIRGATVSFEERHVRPIGVMLLAAAIVPSALSSGRRWTRVVLTTLLAVAALYGTVSLLVGSAIRSGTPALDSYSGTTQQRVSPAALELLRGILQRYERRALFVIPVEAAVALPQGARILPVNIGGLPEVALDELRYLGRVEGPICIAAKRDEKSLGDAARVVRRFSDYQEAEWSSLRVGDSVLFCSVNVHDLRRGAAS